MSYKYLQDEQYYIDLYDLHTIEHCLDYGKGLYAKLPELIKETKLKKLSEDQVKTDLLKTIHIVVHSIKVSRFKEKKAIINE